MLLCSAGPHPMSASDLQLAPLGRDDFARVSHIIVAPDQIRFSGTVHEAFRANEDDVDFHAILLDDHPFGFFKIDRHYAKRIGLAKQGELGLRAFLIDLGQQGQGIGTRAVRALPGYLRGLYPQATALTLTVNIINPAARAAYLRGRFEDTGQIWPHGSAGPQHFLRLPLTGHT